MPPKKKGPTKLIIQRNCGTGSMDDIREVDQHLDMLIAAGEIPKGVIAETDMRDTGVVVKVQSDDRRKAEEFAALLAHREHYRHAYFVSPDNYKPPWERKG